MDEMSKWIRRFLVGFVALFSLALFNSAAASTVDAFGTIFENMIMANRMKPTALKANSTASFDIVMKPQDSTAYYQKALDVNDPTKADFKNYLSTSDIRQQFGQPDAVINGWVALFKKNHLTTHVYQDGLVLNVQGKTKDVNRLFKTNLSDATYHSDPLQFGKSKPNIPANLQDSVLAVMGMADHNKKFWFPDSDVTFKSTPKATKALADKNAGYTSHFTKTYGVDQLYDHGLTGKVQTIGLVSFGNVQTSDLTHFWRHEHVNASKSRFQMVKVLGDNYRKDIKSTSDGEATMDAEYAGSVAPEANIKMFNSGSVIPTLINLINTYLTAYDDGSVNQISSSWGMGPNNYFQILEKMNLLPSQYVEVLNLVLAQSALQGISNFVASGDSGALNYTVVGIHGNDVLLDRKISDADPYTTSPWITSAGGTSLPFKQSVAPNGKSIGTISNQKQRAWGSDYWWPFLQVNDDYLLTMPEFFNDISDGGGGGFSHVYQTPAYQEGVPGVNTFNAREYLSQLSGPVYNAPLVSGTDDGRNYPDISANADATTGYFTYQKTSTSNGWEISGGTSIVSPQFAGVAALINSQADHSRMGFWNPQLYQLATKSDSPLQPLNDTENNSNLYYTGQPNTVYNQASGLGTVDFAKLMDVYK